MTPIAPSTSVNSEATGPTGGGAVRGSGWLAGSAAVLAGLLIVQLGRVGAPTPAWADVAVLKNEFAAATVDAGGEDMLLVLDQRGEALLVYDVFNQATLRFNGREDLRQMFQRARRDANR